MKAMILAAGRGERMRPLTDACPKPLLAVGGEPLIGWHLRRLAGAGVREVVINHAYLGHMIEDWAGTGSRWGLSIRYSAELVALETAGGIRHALPLLGTEPFLVINGDIHTAWPIGRAATIAAQMRAAKLLAWCVMVDNPAHHPLGDFCVDAGRLVEQGDRRRTFSGIGIYHPEMFSALADGEPAKLAPLLRALAARNAIGAEYFAGAWTDVGSPARLAQLDAELRQTRTPS